MNGTGPELPLYAILFWGIITFSFIVIVHELGHFLMARAFGVKVHEFVLGLPGPMLRFKTRITTFGITVVPLGGYVRIAGMEPGEEDPLLQEAFTLAVQRDGTDITSLAQSLDLGIGRSRAILTTLTDWGAIEPVGKDSSHYGLAMDDAHAMDPATLFQRVRSATFRGKKTWQRIVILASGVVFNLIFAILTFSVVLSAWGYMEPTTVIERTLPGTAAEEAGLIGGDRIAAIDELAIAEWTDILSAIDVHTVGDTIVVTVVRDDLELDLTATLGESEQGYPYLGVETRMVNVRLPILTAMRESVKWTGMVFVAIGNLFRPDRFAGTIEDARGVVGVSVEAARAAQRGPVDYAWMVALLSLSLGALNIFPVPPLDGGKILLEFVEKVRGRPVRREVYLGASAIGALLILSLLAYLVYADIIRYVFSG